MDWSSFSLGALASLVIFLVVDSVHQCPECAQRAEQERDPWDWINAEQFRKMIEAADGRYLHLYRRYTRLKSAAQKFRDATTQGAGELGVAAIELDNALIELEPDPAPEPKAGQ